MKEYKLDIDLSYREVEMLEDMMTAGLTQNIKTQMSVMIKQSNGDVGDWDGALAGLQSREAELRVLQQSIIAKINA